MRVLVADDQKRTRQSLRLLLNTLASVSEVREAASGQEAVQLISELQPQVVVMDARMPEMDGVEATRIIKASWPEIKVIVISMYPEYQSEALLVGADAFISKGLPPRVLLSTICELLSVAC
jgi:DNA-binding NarL/FixJ family response regulator